jgi:hypothetical protein
MEWAIRRFREEAGMKKMPFFLVLRWRRWQLEIRLIHR